MIWENIIGFKWGLIEWYTNPSSRISKLILEKILEVQGVLDEKAKGKTRGEGGPNLGRPQNHFSKPPV